MLQRAHKIKHIGFRWKIKQNWTKYVLFVMKYPFVFNVARKLSERKNVNDLIWSFLGREWNLRAEKWAKFYSHSWDWTRARKIWEIDPSHFWSLRPIILGSGWSSWSDQIRFLKELIAPAFQKSFPQVFNVRMIEYINFFLVQKTSINIDARDIWGNLSELGIKVTAGVCHWCCRCVYSKLQIRWEGSQCKLCTSQLKSKDEHYRIWYILVRREVL